MERSSKETPKGSQVTDWSRIQTRKPENVAKRDKALELVCAHFDVTLDAVKGAGKMRHLCIARFVLCVLLRDEVGMTWNAIARFLRKDHSSIIYNYRKGVQFHGEVIAFLRGKISTGEGKE